MRIASNRGRAFIIAFFAGYLATILLIYGLSSKSANVFSDIGAAFVQASILFAVVIIFAGMFVSYRK
jgi:hypothetical protein